MVDLATASLAEKLAFYHARYGLLHTLAAFAGRKSPAFWRLAGPVCTRGYRERWLRSHHPAKLNLGGGGNLIHGFLTGDIDARADCWLDLTAPFPFPDGSFDAIFCEEAIEHVTLDQGRAMLRECYRILQGGGVIRLTTPDLQYFCKRVAEGGASEAYVEMNDIFYKHGHRHLYTRTALETELRAAGFRLVRSSFYRAPASALGHLDSHADRFGHPPEISQYVEAFS